MSSTVYRCPACQQEFISAVAGARNRVICPHCSNSELAARYQEVATDQAGSKHSHLPPARTGQSYRSKRTQSQPQSFPAPDLSSAIESLLRREPPIPELDSPADIEPAPVEEPETTLAERSVGNRAQIPAPEPPILVASRSETEKPLTKKASAAAVPRPGRAAPPFKTSPQQSPIASAVDADFEIVIVHPELSEMGARSLVHSDALHALEPWESDDKAPPTRRWARITLLVLAGLLLLIVAAAAILFALQSKGD